MRGMNWNDDYSNYHPRWLEMKYKWRAKLKSRVGASEPYGDNDDCDECGSG